MPANVLQYTVLRFAVQSQCGRSMGLLGSDKRVLVGGSWIHTASFNYKCSSYERSSLATYQLNHVAVLNDAFPSAYPIHQSNHFPESDNKLLILKVSLFS